ncbi:putative high mobility group B protein 11 isoform X2 [Nicotiana tabacum]|uniref:High mobility group B protein 11 n=2 Tax=Nicotiana TaxID=4085 RepID=A0A1S3Z5C1_TOBAC|nr:PREDICTED: putative high mobility group B protein 11 [Nicotiana tabacum]
MKVCFSATVQFLSMAAEDQKNKKNKTIITEKKIYGEDKYSGAGSNYACSFWSPVVTGNLSAMQSGQSSYNGKDGFYERLNKLNESSGLSLIFNFRETALDLYLFYEEVTKRGGFNQVTRDAKWGEVASYLHVRSNVVMFPTQLQKVYENLLLQFEQMYYYRSREKATIPPPSHQVSGAARAVSLKDYNLSLGSGDSINDSAGKRKYCDWSSPVVLPHSDDKNGPVEKRKCTNDCCSVSTGPETPEQKSQVSATNTYLKKDPSAPIRTRSGYQIYLKLECERLKKVLGESSGSKKIREMAISSWRTLSENDRKPYIEASNKDRERYYREMSAYKQRTKKETVKDQNSYSSSALSIINFGAPPETDNAYYVTLQADAGSNIVPDESLIESTAQMLENANQSDPIFQIDNWGCFT